MHYCSELSHVLLQYPQPRDHVQSVAFQHHVAKEPRAEAVIHRFLCKKSQQVAMCAPTLAHLLFPKARSLFQSISDVKVAIGAVMLSTGKVALFG